MCYVSTVIHLALLANLLGVLSMDELSCLHRRVSLLLQVDIIGVRRHARLACSEFIYLTFV